MQTVLVGAHSGWRWVVLAVALVTLFRSLFGWLRGGAWTALDCSLLLITVNALNVQVFLGVVLWFIERRWSDGVFLGIIHPLVMLLALGVVHLGGARIRRTNEPVARYRILFLSLLLALFLISAAIPPDAWSRAR